MYIHLWFGTGVTKPSVHMVWRRGLIRNQQPSDFSYLWPIYLAPKWCGIDPAQYSLKWPSSGVFASAS
jgi:hypothetical protein